jgi:hypothetical protein
MRILQSLRDPSKSSFRTAGYESRQLVSEQVSIVKCVSW